MPVIGPSDGQRKVLEEFGENLENYEQMPRDEITQFLQNKIGIPGRSNNQKGQSATFQGKRIAEIKAKRLAPGVVVRVFTRDGGVVVVPRKKITEVTESSHIILEGTKKLYAPSAVERIDEGPDSI